MSDCIPPPYGRAIGKTFRHVMKCLIMASEGGKVICVSRNYQNAMHVLRVAKEISKNNWLSHNKNSITFKGGGLFKVESCQERIRGLHYNLITYDD